MLLYPSFAIQMYFTPLHPYLRLSRASVHCNWCYLWPVQILHYHDSHLLLAAGLAGNNPHLPSWPIDAGATSISGTIGVISFCIPYFCAVAQSLLQSSFDGWGKSTLPKSHLCPSSALFSFPYVLFPCFKCATNTLATQEFCSQALVQRYPFHQEWVWLESGVAGTLFNVYRKYSKLSHLNLCSSVLMT